MSIIDFDNKLVKLALFAGPSLLSRYPHYDYIHFVIIILYYVFNPKDTILYNPVFWTSYLSSIGASFDEFHKARLDCDLINEDNIDNVKCAMYNMDVIISVALNLLTYVIGYLRGRGEVAEATKVTEDKKNHKKERKQIKQNKQK
ncbi:hypothetical protein C6P45_001723 [Maudiozyma exigua]|uniref:Uncharacterized protein n=1 Tax=Maudiozyma exigua TaxID=34358 RepID=A0A9P6VZZ1_MAUEX|nr:hypothetical protein C6P45_001723 [Kazachstania exigua]